MSAQITGKYLIRQKVLKLLGAAFFISKDDGTPVGYCDQKAFKLREDIRLFTDESKSDQLLSIRARSVIDFSATYDIFDDNDQIMGSARRRGLKAILRDEWLLFDEDGREIAVLKEDGGSLALARRMLPLVAILAPQRFNLLTADGELMATYQALRNIFIYKLEVTLYATNHADEKLMLALGFLLAAIEGRQKSN